MTTETINRYKIDDKTGCWNWVGAPDTYGYGRISFRINGVRVHKGAHRYVFEKTNGSIPNGMELDHLCRNRMCVNPEHLEVVTHAENIKRGKTGENMRIKTHCPYGHEYSKTNLVGNGKYGRKCRICDNERQRKNYNLKKTGGQ